MRNKTQLQNKCGKHKYKNQDILKVLKKILKLETTKINDGAAQVDVPQTLQSRLLYH